jgi:hypothetical protein
MNPCSKISEDLERQIVSHSMLTVDVQYIDCPELSILYFVPVTLISRRRSFCRVSDAATTNLADIYGDVGTIKVPRKLHLAADLVRPTCTCETCIATRTAKS